MKGLSQEYYKSIEYYKDHHQRNKTNSGKTARPHAAFIKHIIEEYDCKAALDYGCGKGRQYETILEKHGGLTIDQWWGIPLTKYDPGLPQFAAEPQGTYDLVICTQVLGAIPIVDTPIIIRRLHSLAAKVIYIGEVLGPTKKHVIPDASIVHPLNYDAAKWMEVLGQIEPGMVDVIFGYRHKEDKSIDNHYRLKANGLWEKIYWPSHVRTLDHTWA